MAWSVPRYEWRSQEMDRWTDVTVYLVRETSPWIMAAISFFQTSDGGPN